MDAKISVGFDKISGQAVIRIESQGGNVNFFNTDSPFCVDALIHELEKIKQQLIPIVPIVEA